MKHKVAPRLRLATRTETEVDLRGLDHQKHIACHGAFLVTTAKEQRCQALEHHLIASMENFPLSIPQTGCEQM